LPDACRLSNRSSPPRQDFGENNDDGAYDWDEDYDSANFVYEGSDDERDDVEGDEELDVGARTVRFLKDQNSKAAKELEGAQAKLDDQEVSYTKDEKAKLQAHVGIAKKALADTHKALSKLGEASIAPAGLTSARKAKAPRNGDQSGQYLYMNHSLLPKEAEKRPIRLALAIKHAIKDAMEEGLAASQGDGRDVGYSAEMQVMDDVSITTSCLTLADDNFFAVYYFIQKI